MKRITVTLLILFSLCIFGQVARPVRAGAIITSSQTGTVWGKVMMYHGKVIRFTLRGNGWPNNDIDVVIRPNTHIFYTGHPGENLSPNVLHKGEMVRCQGGLTTFMDRLVAQRIIILHG